MSSTNIIHLHTKTRPSSERQINEQIICIRDAINGLKALGESDLARGILEEELNDMRIERFYQRDNPPKFNMRNLYVKSLATLATQAS